MPTALDRDDRLLPRNSAGDPGELSWVAEALQVEKDHFGGLIGIPVLQKVVARDVRTVAGRNEGGQPDSAARGFVENGDTERAGLTEEAHIACHRQDRRQSRIQRDRGVVVRHSQGIRTDEAHSVSACCMDQFAFGRASVRTALAEARRDHHQRFDALVEAVVEYRIDRFCRYSHDGEIDVVGDVTNRRICPNAVYRTMLRVDGIDRSGESAAQQVGQHRVTHLGGVR